MRALTGGAVADHDLADALACEALGVSLDELRAMPEQHLALRLQIKREEARIREAQMPRPGAGAR